MSSTSKAAGHWVNARHLEKDGVRTHTVFPKGRDTQPFQGQSWECTRVLLNEYGRVLARDTFQGASDIVSAKITCEVDYEDGSYDRWVEEILTEEIVRV